MVISIKGELANMKINNCCYAESSIFNKDMEFGLVKLLHEGKIQR